MSTPQTQRARLRSQDDALWAFEQVEQWKAADPSNAKELKSHLRKLPAHLQSSGLAQTLMFYASKHPEIAKALCRRLVNKDHVGQGIKVLAQADAATYRLHSRRAMALAGWLKRYAEATITE